MNINDIKDQYTCLICQNIYTNPIKIAKCGHNMCNDCINNYLLTQTNINCPMCRVPFQKSDIILDQNLNNEMNNKIVKCDNQDDLLLIYNSLNNNKIYDSEIPLEAFLRSKYTELYSKSLLSSVFMEGNNSYTSSLSDNIDSKNSSAFSMYF